jgi:hypothetical protein
MKAYQGIDIGAAGSAGILPAGDVVTRLEAGRTPALPALALPSVNAPSF